MLFFEYLKEQSTSCIMEWNINELIEGNDVLLSKVKFRNK